MAVTTHTLNSFGHVSNLTPQTTASFILKLPAGLRYDGDDAVKPSISQGYEVYSSQGKQEADDQWSGYQRRGILSEITTHLHDRTVTSRSSVK